MLNMLKGLFNILSSTKFMFVVFQSEYTDNPCEMVQSFNVAGNLSNRKTQIAPAGVTGFKLKKIVFWNMPSNDLDEVQRVGKELFKRFVMV